VNVETLEAERFSVYKPMSKKDDLPSIERLITRAMDGAVKKAVADLSKKHAKELDETQRIFYNAGRYAAGARDDTAEKANRQMLFLLGE
jgi:hypothetical protein